MPKAKAAPSSKEPFLNPPALLFDLDGTLIDSAYEHVIAWRDALDAHGIHVPSVRIHRNVGMSGRIMLQGIFAEMRIRSTPQKIDALEKLHKRNFERRLPRLNALPGAPELLKYLTKARIRWAIATSGEKNGVQRMLRSLPIPENTPVITGNDVERAKPHPDVFLMAASRLGVALPNCTVVGDSVWDLLAAQRAKALGVGFLTGGYSATELAEAGAFRIYKDPADLLARISEIGVTSD
jgi:HAD superfamily hydrolase (TIGR01509 family)